MQCSNIKGDLEAMDNNKNVKVNAESILKKLF